MDCNLFLQEKDDFFRRVYGLRLGDGDVLQEAMEKSIEKNGLAKPFLFTPEGLTHCGLQVAFRENIGVDYIFPKELDNLSTVIHARWPLQSYFIRHSGHREAIEGDEALKLLSAEKIWGKKIATMTSLEISQFSFEYALANGAIIDTESLSMASGSRHYDGRVPCVYWYGDGVHVRWCLPSDTSGNLRSRLAVVS